MTLHRKSVFEKVTLQDIHSILETKIYSELVRNVIVELRGVAKASIYIVITYRNCSFFTLPSQSLTIVVAILGQFVKTVATND